MYYLISLVAAANGWHACFRQEDGSLSEQPVACWGIAERRVWRKSLQAWVSEADAVPIAVGLIAGPPCLEIAESHRNFAGYRAPHQQLSEVDNG